MYKSKRFILKVFINIVIIYIRSLSENIMFTKIFIIFLLLILFTYSLGTTDIVLSLPELPGKSYFLENGEPTGSFVEMYKLFKKKYKNGTFTLSGLYPFKRSLINVVTGKADIHFPLIKPKYIDINKLPYDFLPIKIGTSRFVLYTRADDKRVITRENIENFIIEVERGHSEDFNFKTIEGNNIENILKKILRGRTDGYIGPHDIADEVIKKYKYKNLKKQLFEEFDVCFIIPKGERGEIVKKALFNFITEMKKDPEFIKINSKVEKPYTNWQPYEMDW